MTLPAEYCGGFLDFAVAFFAFFRTEIMNGNLMTLPAEYCRNIMSLANRESHRTGKAMSMDCVEPRLTSALSLHCESCRVCNEHKDQKSKFLHRFRAV